MILDNITIQKVNLYGNEYVFMPLNDFTKIKEALEDATDLANAEYIKTQLITGKEETFPSSVLDKIIDDNISPIKVFREYRGITIDELANKLKRTSKYVISLENNSSKCSNKTLSKIASILNVNENLLTWNN